MEPLKIIIDNWPQGDYLATYTPIFIASIALAVSLYSTYLSRKSFEDSSRPYVWAMSYQGIDEQKKLIPIPRTLMYKIKNSPAKIMVSKITIMLGANELFSYTEKNLVSFPDESCAWSFSISEPEFQKILEHRKKSNQNLFRYISVNYSSLNSKHEYQYSSQQEYILEDNQWREIDAKAK